MLRSVHVSAGAHSCQERALIGPHEAGMQVAMNYWVANTGPLQEQNGLLIGNLCLQSGT